MIEYVPALGRETADSNFQSGEFTSCPVGELVELLEKATGRKSRPFSNFLNSGRRPHHLGGYLKAKRCLARSSDMTKKGWSSLCPGTEERGSHT